MIGGLVVGFVLGVGFTVIALVLLIEWRVGR